MKHSRFAPALTPTGRAVAVNVGWLFVMTTAEKETQKPEPRPSDAVVAAPADRLQPAIQPAVVDEAVPVDRRSAASSDLTTA
jgi:hypothetical protein